MFENLNRESESSLRRDMNDYLESQRKINKELSERITLLEAEVKDLKRRI